MSDSLSALLQAAADRRSDLVSRLIAEDTNTYRLFHGSVEGVAGLTVDRYGDLLLVQSFHQSLEDAELDEIRRFYAGLLPELQLVYNDRSGKNSRINNSLSLAEQAVAEENRVAHELGIRYHIRGRHSGQDPWLFLDLRAGRRRVMQLAEGKSVLNLFAYTCGVGLAAAKGGAQFVMNVDFAESSLAVGAPMPSSTAWRPARAACKAMPLPPCASCPASASPRWCAARKCPPSRHWKPASSIWSSSIRHAMPKARLAWLTWSTTTRPCSSRPCCAPPKAAC
ncbi:class I SAM-dependent methyltransferase [Aquitalea magnusonii]|uniref:class I SAM-dependent methyltransferase n=1 Tax=Aquitalea magnusonii TaxID=332411 RepID=UPI000B20A63C|nr:class I SAM-dependent methyltransferase [Aquitalea magnusonii]